MAFKFEHLEVWQISIEFANQMFDVAQKLPQEYRFSLADQLRRAALSIPTNIAEGTGRSTVRDQGRFYQIAKGSAYEVVSLLVMLHKRGQLNETVYQTHYKQANRIAAMLSGLINRPDP